MNLTDDGLPIAEVGEWVHEKHARLTRYVEISKHVRRKFTARAGAGATFIDLYCGPGRCRVRETHELVDGSAIVAALAAQESGFPFSSIYIGDMDTQSVRASTARLGTRGVRVPVHQHIGPAEVTAREVVAQLNPHALHLVFLDPYNLGDLPITVLEPFGALGRADILIHVSAMDLQRNLENAVDAKEGHQFDLFAPGWRDAVDTSQPPREVRHKIRRYWIGLVERMGFRVFEHQFTPIRGSRKQLLYWLAFAAKHDKASEFWDKIRHIEPQKGFAFQESQCPLARTSNGPK